MTKREIHCLAWATFVLAVGPNMFAAFDESAYQERGRKPTFSAPIMPYSVFPRPDKLTLRTPNRCDYLTLRPRFQAVLNLETVAAGFGPEALPRHSFSGVSWIYREFGFEDSHGTNHVENAELVHWLENEIGNTIGEVALEIMGTPRDQVTAKPREGQHRQTEQLVCATRVAKRFEAGTINLFTSTSPIHTAKTFVFRDAGGVWCLTQVQCAFVPEATTFLSGALLLLPLAITPLCNLRIKS